VGDLRKYGWIAMSVLVVLAAGPAVQKSRGPEMRGRTFRMGYEESPPTQIVGTDGLPSSAVIDIVREAARRSGIHLLWFTAIKEPKDTQAHKRPPYSGFCQNEQITN
jgi:hypothetical protein